MNAPIIEKPLQSRLVSLDQFRGYAIFSMILVNVLGHFQAMPWMLKHHATGFSYADLVAPVFVFVVGIGFRMSLLRRIARDGRQAAYRAAVRRYLILAGLGCLYGGLHFRAGVWDALMDIGCSGLLALPFLERSARVRLFAAAGYLALYQLIYSFTGYGEWVVSRSMNGGPLGPLSWVFMLLLGTLAGDLMLRGDRRRILWHGLVWALLLSVLGWAFRAEWPGLKLFWPFSPYMMSVPYPLYATGLAFALLIAFYLLCDVAGWRFPHLSLLGRNPLVLYLLQALLVVLVRVIFPSTLNLPRAILVFAGVYTVCYWAAWGMHRRGIIVKI